MTYDLIKNKKGAQGYKVKPWNFGKSRMSFDESEYEGQRLVGDNYSHEWQIMIEKVEVISCGKVLMHLRSLERVENITLGKDFAPDLRIHATLESAVEDAQVIYNKTIEKHLATYEKKIDDAIVGITESFKNNPRRNSKELSDLTQLAIKVKEGIAKGEDHLVVLRYPEWEQDMLKHQAKPVEV